MVHAIFVCFLQDSRAQTHGLQLAGQGATPKLSDSNLSVNGRLWQFNDTWARDSSRKDSLPPHARAFLASHGQKQSWAAHALPYLPAVRLPATFHHLPALNQHPTQLLFLQAFSSSTPPPSPHSIPPPPLLLQASAPPLLQPLVLHPPPLPLAPPFQHMPTLPPQALPLLPQLQLPSFHPHPHPTPWRLPFAAHVPPWRIVFPLGGAPRSPIQTSPHHQRSV
ncbi:hypothetical protein V8C86DRAFT_1112945 [Haematococcus lacustris]